MEIKVHPSNKNHYPLSGFFIQSDQVTAWLTEIQNLGQEVGRLRIYPLPGKEPNSVWGCLVLLNGSTYFNESGKLEACQRVDPYFHISENARVTPTLTEDDSRRLFGEKIHVFHPDVGYACLEEQFKPVDVLKSPKERYRYIFQPETSVSRPGSIKSFRLVAPPEEDTLKNLEETSFPEKEKMPDKPLNSIEKGKLSLYQKLFKKKVNEKGEESLESGTFMKEVSSFANLFSKKKGTWEEKVKQDYEDLEERNKKEIDKLLDMLEKDPENALKYAVPLDNEGSSRGTNNGQLELTKRWGNLSLSGREQGGGGSGSVDIGNHFHELSERYNATARELKERGQYEKAAFVYMKLLKDYRMAAATLEEGKLYAEAAAIYLKYCEDKTQAAKCYEHGRLYEKAIDLYKELEDSEKVGDLYLELNNRVEANRHYEDAATKLLKRSNYIQAAEIYDTKMEDEQKARTVLLEGWETNSKRRDCLRKYLSYYPVQSDLKSQIEQFYRSKVEGESSQDFLSVIQTEYISNPDQSDYLKEIALEIIVKEAPNNRAIVNELRVFRPADKELPKDLNRFKFQKKES